MCKEHLPIVEKLDNMTNKVFAEKEGIALLAAWNTLGEYMVRTYGHANIAKLEDLQSLLAAKKFEDAYKDALDALLEEEAPF